MRRIIFVFSMIAPMVLSPEFAFAAKKKPPKPVKCPVVVDLETRELSNTKTKYQCFGKIADAKFYGYTPISGASAYEKVKACPGDLAQSQSLLAQKMAELAGCGEIANNCSVQLSACRDSHNNSVAQLTTCSSELSDKTTRLATCTAALDAALSNPSCPLPIPSPTGLVSVDDFYLLEGAAILAGDGQFLGTFSTNRFSADSINNSYGSYGSEHSSTSIFNNYSSYGSSYGTGSAFNEFSSTPPIIIIGTQAVAYLTTNRHLTPRVNSHQLKGWLMSREY